MHPRSALSSFAAYATQPQRCQVHSNAAAQPLTPPILASAHDAWKKIEEIAEVVEPKAIKRREFLDEAKSGAFDGVVAIYRTFASGLKTGRIDEEVLAALPESLKFISHNGMFLYPTSFRRATKLFQRAFRGLNLI